MSLIINMVHDLSIVLLVIVCCYQDGSVSNLGDCPTFKKTLVFGKETSAF